MAQGGRIDYTIGFNVDKTGLKDLQKQLETIQKMSVKEVQAANPNLTNMNEARSALMKAQIAANDLGQAMQKAFNTKLGVMNIEKLQSSLKQLNLNDIQQRFSAIGVKGQQAFLNVAKSALTTNVNLKQTSKIVDKIGTTLMNTLKWQFSSSLVNRFTGAIQQAYGYVQHLDTSLNDIRIVTGKSADEMERFATKANKAAQALGKSTTDYTEASLIYYQQGLSDQEVAARAETTLKAANVTGQSTAAVSEELTAVWNGYKIATEQTEAAVDKLAAVAATTASDLQELSTGMSKVASAANAMGVDMDQLNAQIATIISVTRQAPESVGTALKTIYARLADLKLGDTDEDGLGLGDVSGALDKVGIAVLDANGDLREMGDVIEDVAAKWNTWTSAQQTAIAQVMAGKRQYNNLVALFENWDMYSNALDTSRNSLGTLQEQQDIYMESVEAHIKQLKTEWEDLYDSILDEGFIKGTADGLKGILNIITNIVDGIGGGRTLLTGLLALIGTKFGKQISQIFTPFIENMRNAKINAAQLQTLLTNITEFEKRGDFGNKAAEAMRKAQQETSTYWHLMTEGEINSSQEVIREIGAWTQKKEEILQAEEALKSYINTYTTQTLKNSIQGKTFLRGNTEGGDLLSNSAINEVNERLLKDQERTVDALNTKYKEVLRTIKIFNDEQKAGTLKGDKRVESLKTMSVVVDKLRAKLKETKELGLVDENKIDQADKAVEKLKKKIEELQQSGNKKGSIADYLKEDLKAVAEVADITGAKFKIFFDVINNGGSFEEATAKIETYKKALETLQNKTALVVDSISKIVGGISSYVFALQSLTNIGSIWNNDDLETGEKILQLLSAFIIAIPMLTRGLLSVATGIQTIATIRKKEAIVQAAQNVASGVENAQDATKIGLKKILTKVILGEKAAEEGLAAATWIALGAFAAFAAILTVVSAVSSAHQKRLEQEAEALQKVADAQHERVEATQAEKDAIDDLAKSYQDLKDQRAEDNEFTEDQKNQVYELVKAYGDQDLIIQALAGDYEKLEESIKKSQEAANAQTIQELNQDEASTRNAIVGNIIANASKSERDRAGYYDLGQLGGFNKHQNFRDDLAKLIGASSDVINSSGHISHDDLLKVLTADRDQLSKFLLKYSNLEAAQQISKLLQDNQTNLEQLQKDINQRKTLEFEQIGYSESENIDKIEDLGQFEEEIEKITQRALEKGLVDTEDEGRKLAKEFLGGYSDEMYQYEQDSYIAEELLDNILPTEEEFNARIDSIKAKLKEFGEGGNVNLLNRTPIPAVDGSSGYSTLYTATFANDDKTVAINFTPIIEDPETGEYLGTLTEEELEKYALDVINGVREDDLNLQIGARFEGEDALEKANQAALYIHHLSAQLYNDYLDIADEVYYTVENASESEKQWMLKHQALMKQYAFPTDALYDFQNTIERFNTADTVIKVKTLLTDLDGKEFKPENIQAIFDNTDFTIKTGVTQEEFTDKSHELQLVDIAQYYLELNKSEIEFEKEKAENLTRELEDQKQILDYKKEQLDLTKEEIEKEYERYDIDVNVLDEDRVQFIKDQIGLFEELGEIRASVWGTDTVRTEEQEIELLSRFRKGLEEVGDGYAYLEVNEVGIIKLLQQEKNLSDEQLAYFAAELEAADKWDKKTKSLGLSSKKYQEMVDEVVAAQMDLVDAMNEVTDVSVDWTDMFKTVAELLEDTNKHIDDLQTAYDSLTSIIDGYNETQVLTMDNLQTLLNMDTAYLEALQIEDGQLVLNEEALKNIALARLDEAEAEAYEQAMAELLSDDLRNQYNATQTAAQGLNDLGDAASQAAAAARAGVDDWNDYWAAATNSAGVSADAYSKSVGDALRTKLQAIDTVRNQILSGQFKATVGKSSSSKSGGSGSSKKPDREKYLEREEDIYREINEQLEEIESTLGRIQTLNDHEWGYDAQKTLEEENRLLDQQVEKLQQKKKLQEGDLSYRRKQLELEGVQFSEDGSSMANAEAVLNGLYAHYNQMVDVYNAMSVAEQETYKATLEAEKDRIDKIEGKIDNYESLYSDYQSTLDEILDKHFEQIENTVKQFNNMVEVHLELSDAKKEWTDFWYDVVKDVEENDFAEQISKSLDKLRVLIGAGARAIDSDVSILTNHTLETIEEVQKQIASANEGGSLSMFGDDSALAKETLTDYRDKLMESLTSAKEEVDNISDAYLGMLDEAKEKLDNQVAGWEAIGDHIQHGIDLIKLVSGEDSYDALNTQFEKQYKNNLELVEAQKMAKDEYAEQIEKYSELLKVTEKGSVEWKTYSAALEKASENYKEAVKSLDSTVTKAIEDLYKWKQSQISEIEDAFDKGLSGNMGLSDLEDNWNLINDSANRYLDNVERALEMEGLENEFDKIINSTNLTAEAQAKLNKMRDEELNKLSQRTKLSQYDIDEVKARLEITKQEMALEDARRNKSNLRLRRDSQGNYSYQYTSDDSQIDAAEDGVLSAKKEWYQLVKSRNIDLVNEIIANRKELSAKFKELNETDWTNNEAGRQRLLDEIAKLQQREVELQADAEKAKQDLFSGTAVYFENVQNASMLPQWEATVTQLSDAWDNGGEGSFIGTIRAGIEKAGAIQEEFGLKTMSILQMAGIQYEDLRTKGIDPTIDALEELVGTNEELAQQLDETNTQLDQQEINLRKVEEAYNSLKTAAVEAIQSANDTLEQLAKTAIETQQQIQASIQAAEQAAQVTSTIKSTNYNGNNTTTTSGSPSGGTPRGAKTTDKPYTLYSDPNGVAGNLGIWDGKKWLRIFGDYRYKTELQMAGMIRNAGYTRQNTKADGRLQKYLASMRSGGYTGAWNGSASLDDLAAGRIALLHEKELVLNAEDTENVLKAINILRGISVDKIAESIIAAARASTSVLNGVGTSLMQTVAGLTQNVQSGNMNNFSRNMTVNADFSGVKTADAIYQALMELDNYGMQESYSTAAHSNRAY